MWRSREVAVRPLLEVVFQREGVPASGLHGDLRLAAQARSSPVPESGTASRLELPSPRSIAALWRSTKLPDRPCTLPVTRFEAHVGGGAFLEAVGHRELRGALALDVAAEGFGHARAGQARPAVLLVGLLVPALDLELTPPRACSSPSPLGPRRFLDVPGVYGAGLPLPSRRRRDSRTGVSWIGRSPYLRNVPCFRPTCGRSRTPSAPGVRGRV